MISGELARGNATRTQPTSEAMPGPQTDNHSANEQPAPEKPREAAPPGQGTDRRSTDRADADERWDLIDEHAWESFPASDAPARWAGPDLSPAERDEKARAAAARRKDDAKKER